MRSTVKRINPVTTAVITFGDVLEEAVQHYKQQSMPSLPPFVLADWDGSSHAAWEETADRLQVEIFPITAHSTLKQQQICLYTRQNRTPWLDYGFWVLLNLCAAHGLTNVLLDATVTQPNEKRPPRPDFIQQHFEDIVLIYARLADEESREVFLRAMKSLETGDAGYLPMTAYPQYGHPLVSAHAGDFLIDGGLDTECNLTQFADIIGKTGHIFAFEPRQKACDAIREKVKDIPQITVEQLALWSSANTFYIKDNNGGSFLVQCPDDDTEECHSIDIDSYLQGKQERCSLIKLDIEGAEMACLQGAASTIARDYPKLQISIYHREEHYLEIPLWVIENYPDYKLYMGHHGCWYYETCLYALPPQDKGYKPKAN